MPKIQLYIACSLDGYIAREDGKLDWLDAIPNPDKSDFGYFDFYAGVDIVVMGRGTYEEVLGFDVDWPYPDRKTYVTTTNETLETPTPNTGLVQNIDKEFIGQLKAESQKNIWLCGGGQVIKSFLELGAVDEMILSIVPTLIGAGLPLFPRGTRETSFDLVDTKSYNGGAVVLTYRKKN